MQWSFLRFCWFFGPNSHAGKRITSMIFSDDSAKLLISDKFGDVYSFALTQTGDTGSLLLGHLSLITDIVRG
jgi:tRNA (guanine-N(7)-)-methyltransferase subunit TRM82